MKIFITGASGFIGKKLVQKLAKSNHHLTVLTRSNSFSFPKNVHVIVSDIENTKAFKRQLNNHDVLVHLAGIRADWGNKEKFIEINGKILTKLISRKTKLKHIISTSSVYALGKLEYLPANENHPLKAKDVYGQSKIVSEQTTKSLAGKLNIPYTIIRPAIVYGPNDNELGMISKIVALIKDRKMPIIGNGKNLIHLIYIDDLVEGYIKAINQGGDNQTYILAGPETITLEKLIDLIARKLNIRYSAPKFPRLPMEVFAFFVEMFFKIGYALSPKIFSHEPPITPQKIANLSLSWKYDISNAKKGLKFSPKVGYQSGIRKTLGK